MKARIFLLCTALFMIVVSADAQEYLVLRKKGSTRKYQFFRGSQIIYKMKGFDGFLKDRITDFADSTIVMENNIILVEQLYEVDVRNAVSNRSEILRSAESLLPGIGVSLMAIDLFNHTVVDGGDFSLDRRVTTTSAVLIGTGYALKFMRRKMIRLHNPKFEAFIVGF